MTSTYTPDICRMLVLSTGHLTAEIAKQMGAGQFINSEELSFAYYNVEYGWYLPCVANKDDSSCPECVKLILEKAHSLGCTKVLLDCDGAQDPTLPVYEW